MGNSHFSKAPIYFCISRRFVIIRVKKPELHFIMQRTAWNIVKNLLSMVNDATCTSMDLEEYFVRLAANVMTMDKIPDKIPTASEWKQFVNEDIIQNKFAGNLFLAEQEIDDADMEKLAQSPTTVQELLPFPISSMIIKVQRLAAQFDAEESARKIREYPMQFVMYLALCISETWNRKFDLSRNILHIERKYLNGVKRKCDKEAAQQDMIDFCFYYTISSLDTRVIRKRPNVTEETYHSAMAIEDCAILSAPVLYEHHTKDELENALEQLKAKKILVPSKGMDSGSRFQLDVHPSQLMYWLNLFDLT